MPHGRGPGRSGGTRAPGVSSRAGSGPLLLSESVSGAPTVCSSMGVGALPGTKGASPRTFEPLVGSHKPTDSTSDPRPAHMSDAFLPMASSRAD
ncbi:mCG5223, isoform CRA_a [Mus musculus]|nr:mCG5223, isoform CRA_a [Mus musculus]